MEETHGLAEGIWHELHRGVYAGDVRELQLHRKLPLPWSGTIHGGILSGTDYFEQCCHCLPDSLVDV